MQKIQLTDNSFRNEKDINNGQLIMAVIEIQEVLRELGYEIKTPFLANDKYEILKNKLNKQILTGDATSLRAGR